MHPVKTIALAMLAWPVAEIVAFFCVVAVVGFGTAILLIVLTSLAGLFILRHFSGNAQRLRSSDGFVTASVFGGGTAPVLGGIFMLVPGFLATVLGILILLPLSRRWLLAQFQQLFAARPRPRDPDVIDLAPEEWRSMPGEKLPPSAGQ
ncbi:MAG: FxsA family protein [Bradyrhizobiaceae bacterium]|nr:FxsA family protein [Bradyrhizobiaceae bacterium]